MLPLPTAGTFTRRGRFALTRRAIATLLGLVVVLGLGLPIARAWPALAVTLFGSSTTVHDDQLALSIEVPNRSFRPNEPIPITAIVTYIGTLDTVTLSGEYADGVYFSLEQLAGPLDMDGGVSRLICYPTTLRRGVATSIPFAKSGGWDESDANASFWREYFADPSSLRLPAGSWRVGAHLRAAIDQDCANANHSLDTAVSFTVAP
jgi:hypothetical protein